jgi:hypothetical protein
MFRFKRLNIVIILLKCLNIFQKLRDLIFKYVINLLKVVIKRKTMKTESLSLTFGKSEFQTDS